MKCPQCHTDNASDNLFCSECGAVLPKAGGSTNTASDVSVPARGLGMRHTVMEILEGSPAQLDSFSSALFLMFISSLLFSSLIYIIEGHEQPGVFPSIPAAMHWFFVTIISGWGNVDPVTYAGVVLVIITQIMAIALAAILTGVVSTAYTTQVIRREAMYEMEIREVLADGVVTPEEEAHLRAMQTKFGMSDEQVAAIAAQVRTEQKTDEQ